MAELTTETGADVTAQWTPPDQAARERITTDLHTSLLVEAGAGSGKTTAMVGRMIELIRTGTASVDQIAAVTFTRKAASELRERFQERLEEEYRRAHAAAAAGAGGDADVVRDRLSAALSGLDRCFVGTIHSFCGRLLRERPLEAGVPPGFEEISGADEDRLRLESWSRFLERLSARHSRLSRRLASLGLRPGQLRELFRELSDNPDVRYVAAPVETPTAVEIQRLRLKLDSLLEESLALLPDEQPAAGWDGLQKKVRTLKFSRFFPGWSSDAHFLDALATALGTKNSVTQNRWGADKETKAAAKALGERWDDFCADGSPARQVYDRWLACRYREALRLARAAAGVYAAERRRTGKLNFQDLLLLTACLLREHPEVRRELGSRYRYLLVDEFQDTDPIQAEVVFLLASEPEGETHWSRCEPRPGSLFVVGDPKQSIYRFRRADISVYGQVKRRFREIGDVLGLTANFRSTRPIERFVNAVFDGPFPAEETAHQAAFAPLAVKPAPRAGEGVYWYAFPAAEGRGAFTGARIAEPESALLASWIAERIARGERKPSDFMILTRTKSQLAAYARALEARNVPVQVSGAGVGAEEELQELILLLRCLCDAGDPVLTLAVLEGLFFGFSHEELYAHVRAGGDFSYLRDSQPADSPVTAALRRIRSFWLLARNAPADVAIPRIVEALGVLPYAAAGELGGTRAGALLYALDVVRAAAVDGTTSLLEAVEVLETALEEEVDAPLFPGEAEAVRVMNLHKSKGLEAPVVILAYPAAERGHGIDRHVTRDEDGRAIGYVKVTDSSRKFGGVIAMPPDWADHEAAEVPFGDAEDARLLYVAATRAGDELVVGRCNSTADTSVWRAFHPHLDDPVLAAELRIEQRPPVARQRIEEDGATIQQRVERLKARRDALARPSFVAASVTARAKGTASFPAGGGGGGLGRGLEWGRAVHRALEVAMKGLAAGPLAGACRSILIDEERPVDDHGAPTELAELVELVETLRRSGLWQRSSGARQVLVEVPFQVSFPGPEAEALGIAESAAGAVVPPQVVEGVIDLAFQEAGGGWVIADYKTDRFVSAEARRERTAIYQRQVDLYALCWERITSERVVERVLFFTSDQSEVSWQAPFVAPLVPEPPHA